MRPRAAEAVQATAAMARPIVNSAAMARMTARISPPGFFGALAPKNTMLTISRSSIEITIRHVWTTSWAPSTQEAGAGVVDRRRRMPCSR